MDGRIASLDDAPYWIERGQGLPVVFLHGYPLTHQIFEPQLEPISRDHHAILLDLPGYALAAGQSVPDSLSGFADRVHEFLAERFSTRVVLLGHSFGGYIALELMRRHPEQLRALILADTRSQADTPEARQKRIATADCLQTPGEQLDSAQIARTLVARSTWEKNGPLVDHVRSIAASVPTRTVIATLRALADRPDLTPVLATIRVPTLILWGVDDQLIPPSQSAAMVPLVPGCTGEGLAGAGHLPSLESPDAFSRTILTFLGRLDAGSPH